MGMLGVFPRGTVKKHGYTLKLFITSFADYARICRIEDFLKIILIFILIFGIFPSF
jgi:hypothetical protein